MKTFEYELTQHSISELEQHGFVCSESGVCGVEAAGDRFVDTLNARGADGWELVQTMVGRDNVVAVWKREK